MSFQANRITMATKIIYKTPSGITIDSSCEFGIRDLVRMSKPMYAILYYSSVFKYFWGHGHMSKESRAFIYNRLAFSGRKVWCIRGITYHPVNFDLLFWISDGKLNLVVRKDGIELVESRCHSAKKIIVLPRIKDD